MNTKVAVYPYLNEFLYNVLYSATEEQRKAIPRRYIKKVKTHTAAKMFCNKSSLEEKLDLLTCLRVRWTLVCFDKKKNQQETVNQIFEPLKTASRPDFVNIAVQNGLYLMSDRQFAFYQELMSDQTNHTIFSQNLLLSKAGYHLHKWKKKIKAGETEVAKEHEKVAPYLIETVLNTAVNLEYIDGLLQMTPNDFKVLCYLYIRHHVYVKYEELMQRFSGHLSNSKITSCVRRLGIAQMLQRPPNPNVKEYQITAIGIKAISSFWRQILKANEIQ